jgi:hypothetical protein
MNDTNKRLLFVGLGVIFCLIWLSRNDIGFNKKINLILHAGYVQGNLLDKNMDGDLCKTCRLMETMIMEISEVHAN